MKKAPICDICQERIIETGSHDSCMTEDTRGCHDTEFEHFAYLDQKTNQEVDESLGK